MCDYTCSNIRLQFAMFGDRVKAPIAAMEGIKQPRPSVTAVEGGFKWPPRVHRLLVCSGAWRIRMCRNGMMQDEMPRCMAGAG